MASGCSDSDKTPSPGFDTSAGVLRYVPSDTPYLIAKPGDIPDELLDKLEPQLDTVLKAYHSIIRATVENTYAGAREAEADLSTFEVILPLVDELEGLMSVEGLRQAGIGRNADFALYGVGLLPVFRLSLTDGDMLESVMARMEEKVGEKMPTATLGGHSYRYAGDSEERLIVAVIDNELVIAAISTELSDDLLKRVLGLTLPDTNIADSGELNEIAESYGLIDYMVGVFDFERIASAFLDTPSGINAELLSLTENEAAQLSAVCKAEISSLVGVMPRIVFGYTALDVRKMSSKLVIELREDIAAGVSTLTGTVPGLAQPHDGLFSLGLSADLLAARTFYSERLDALEAEPYKCEQLADLQQGVAAGREILNQPIPPVVYGFKGFLAVVKDINGMDPANNVAPTSIDMQFVLAMDNAESLLAMGAMFSPELAALSVEADGVPIKLAMPQIDATGLDVHVALTEKALGLSIGEGMQDGLADLMTAEAPEPSPFLVADLDAQKYYSMMGDVMAARLDNADAIPELQEGVQVISQSIRRIMDRVRVVVNFTKNGIEVDSDVQLVE